MKFKENDMVSICSIPRLKKHKFWIKETYVCKYEDHPCGKDHNRVIVKGFDYKDRQIEYNLAECEVELYDYEY